jgi:hypothetical protein
LQAPVLKAFNRLPLSDAQYLVSSIGLYRNRALNPTPTPALGWDLGFNRTQQRGSRAWNHQHANQFQRLIRLDRRFNRRFNHGFVFFPTTGIDKNRTRGDLGIAIQIRRIKGL